MAPSLSPSARTVVHLTSNGGSLDQPLPSGNYTLTLFSPQNFKSSQVTFGSAFHFPESSINVLNPGHFPADGSSKVQVALAGSVDATFLKDTHVSLQEPRHQFGDSRTDWLAAFPGDWVIDTNHRGRRPAGRRG